MCNGDEVFLDMWKRCTESIFIWVAPRDEKSCGLPKQTPLGGHHTAVRPYYLHEKNSPLELPRAIGQSTLEGCVGTLKDGYIPKVPLPRVQRIQSASDYTKTTQSQVDAYEYASGKGTPSPDYLPVSSWIPMLPKLGRLIRFSQRILWPFPPIAIKAKNNILSSAQGLVESLEQSTSYLMWMWRCFDSS